MAEEAWKRAALQGGMKSRNVETPLLSKYYDIVIFGHPLTDYSWTTRGAAKLKIGYGSRFGVMVHGSWFMVHTRMV